MAQLKELLPEPIPSALAEISDVSAPCIRFFSQYGAPEICTAIASDAQRFAESAITEEAVDAAIRGLALPCEVIVKKPEFAAPGIPLEVYRIFVRQQILRSVQAEVDEQGVSRLLQMARWAVEETLVAALREAKKEGTTTISLQRVFGICPALPYPLNLLC